MGDYVCTHSSAHIVPTQPKVLEQKTYRQTTGRIQ